MRVSVSWGYTGRAALLLLGASPCRVWCVAASQSSVVWSGVLSTARPTDLRVDRVSSGDLRAHDLLDLGALVGLDRPRVCEVEAQLFGVDERAALVDLATKHLTNRDITAPKE